MHTKKDTDICALSYPRAESNRNRQNRNLEFYPLNYGGKLHIVTNMYCRSQRTAKVRIFWLYPLYVRGFFSKKSHRLSGR